MVLFPLLAVILIATFKTMPHIYSFLIREDGLVEWATAIVYFIAAGFAASLALYEFLIYTKLVPLGLTWYEYSASRHLIITGSDQEPIELLLSFGFLLFTVLNWVRYRVGAPFTLSSVEGEHAQPLLILI